MNRRAGRAMVAMGVLVAVMLSIPATAGVKKRTVKRVAEEAQQAAFIDDPQQSKCAAFYKQLAQPQGWCANAVKPGTALKGQGTSSGGYQCAFDRDGFIASLQQEGCPQGMQFRAIEPMNYQCRSPKQIPKEQQHCAQGFHLWGDFTDNAAPVMKHGFLCSKSPFAQGQKPPDGRKTACAKDEAKPMGRRLVCCIQVN